MKAFWIWLFRTDADRPEPADGDLSHFIESAGVRLARVFALAILVGGTIASIGYVTLNHAVPPGVSIPFPILGLVVLILLQRGHARPAILLLLWGMCLVALFAAATFAGLKTLGLMALPIVMMAAGWLVGQRQALALTVTAITGILGLYGLHAADVEFQGEARLHTYTIAYLLVVVLGAAIGTSTARIVRTQYDRAVALGTDLKTLNADLETRVVARTAELSAALERLQRTQDDLIQAEKLASLGSMVAGISHELNTPIGNAVTVISTLHERAGGLKAAAQSGTLKKSDLDNGLSVIIEMSELIDRSVNRAATLVASFKQVAVDQTSELRREFDLKRLVEDVCVTLRPGLKHTPWHIVNSVPVGIQCDSFPGPLGQVLTNLIQNAVIHAFPDRADGRIEVSGHIDDHTLVLEVLDDGIGMSTATLVRIFDPFFTTKLGKGGSGLGLSICRRIVNNILAGELNVQSTAGAGSRFTVRMPLRTPGKI